MGIRILDVQSTDPSYTFKDYYKEVVRAELVDRFVFDEDEMVVRLGPPKETAAGIGVISTELPARGPRSGAGGASAWQSSKLKEGQLRAPHKAFVEQLTKFMHNLARSMCPTADRAMPLKFQIQGNRITYRLYSYTDSKGQSGKYAIIKIEYVSSFCFVKRDHHGKTVVVDKDGKEKKRDPMLDSSGMVMINTRKKTMRAWCEHTRCEKRCKDAQELRDKEFRGVVRLDRNDPMVAVQLQAGEEFKLPPELAAELDKYVVISDQQQQQAAAPASHTHAQQQQRQAAAARPTAQTVGGAARFDQPKHQQQ